MHRAAFITITGFIGMHAVEPNAFLGCGIRVLIGQRPHMAAGVPFLAIRRASMAADTGIQINHQAKLLGPRYGSGQGCHGFLSPALKRRISGGSGILGGGVSALGWGAVMPSSPGAHFLIFTRRSYQAA